MINSEVKDSTDLEPTASVEEPIQVTDLNVADKDEKVMKQDKVAEPAEKVRNKRFFGVLMGTLNKFQKESLEKTEADIKRELINQKLQEKLSKQREEIKEKIEQDKRQRQAWKEETIRERQRREAERVALSKLKDEASRSHFLCTVSEPKVFYLPRKLLPKLEDQISAQKKQLSGKSDIAHVAKV